MKVAKHRGSLHRDTDESAANASLTLSTTVDRPLRILYVTVKYSAPVTVDVTITLNSGGGAAWDTILQTLKLAGAQDAVWIPDHDIEIGDDDAIDVVAPAGGAGVTSAIAIFSEVRR